MAVPLMYLFSSAELHFDVEMESPEWTVESPDIVENLRPPTPTGCLEESDPDLLIRIKPTSPVVEEMERPQTPGRNIASELSSADEVLALSPVSAELLLVPCELNPPSHQERPKTPGRDDKSEWTLQSSGRAPSTPGREMMSGSSREIWPTLSNLPSVQCMSVNPYIIPPKTPGRDIILPRRDVVHRRKTQPMATSPCSPSDSTSNSEDGGVSHIISGMRTKPLQGLENMPGLLYEDIHRETEKSLSRRKQLRRLRRRWRVHQYRRSLTRAAGSLSCHSHPPRRRSLCEEWRILHRFWEDGLDEEDFRLLQCTYDRLQAEDNGLGWISDALWTHHPHILPHKSLQQT